ncbi:MAG TPA: hypothetical protein VF178_00905 [Gemmatimonadaceae bacterium]
MRRYYLPTDTEHEWWIYDPRGVLIATMRTPARLRITEIGRDYVLGVWRDESDVQTVRRYALLRQQPNQLVARPLRPCADFSV